MYQEKTLTCRDCGNKFAFTVSEQEFYAEKGFTNEPGRCPDCRAARKASGNSRGGRSTDRQMYEAVCASCHTKTQVPFRPSNDKPVYCKECYNQKRSRY